MRAGTQDDVFVTVEYERKIFGKITGRSGVSWEDSNDQQGGN